jgi:hypothetical protein
MTTGSGDRAPEASAGRAEGLKPNAPEPTTIHPPIETTRRGNAGAAFGLAGVLRSPYPVGQAPRAPASPIPHSTGNE